MAQYPPPQPPYASWGRPPGPNVVWAVLLWLVAVGSLVVGLLFAAGAVAGFWLDSQLDAAGVTTTATVTDVDYFSDTYTVEFTTEDGEPATAEIIWPSATPAVGDQVEITYEAGAPSHAVEAGSSEELVLGILSAVVAVFSVAVAIGAGVGAVLVHRARGRALRRAATW